MSFTSEVKKQICKEPTDRNQARAQICALFQMRASMHMNFRGMSVSYQTENATIAKHLFQMLKQVYKVNPRLSVIRNMRLKKSNMYRVEVYDKASEILDDLGILTDTGIHYKPLGRLIRSDKMARAYLCGCFLASGSINDPKTANYHLEMSTTESELAQSVQHLMERYHLPAKITKRKKYEVVYLKAGDKIADFLRLCNASQALFEFEDSRIQRDFFNQMTRLDNCEVANEMKTQKAAKKQLEAIAILEANPQKVDISEKIRHVMEIRKQFPDASMNELCEEVYRAYGDIISKSGMKHRLNRIKEMAASIQEESV